MPGDFSLARLPHEAPPLPIGTLLSIIFIVGLLGAIVFLSLVAPAIGSEKVKQIFDQSSNLDKLFKDIGSTGITSPIISCGNKICENGENISSCLQDCYVCNANGTCEASLGENQNSCSADCKSNGSGGGSGGGDGGGGGGGGGGGSGGGGGGGGGGSGGTGGEPPTPSCGDGSCNGSENCSSCAQDCGSCPPTQTCGNNIREGNEKCDGTDLNAQTCQTKGYTSGTLSCRTDCTGFDTSQCTLQQNFADRITQFGITWTFDRPYRVGQFVNGDWWVQGPVNVISVSPSPTISEPYLTYTDLIVENDPYNAGKFQIHRADGGSFADANSNLVFIFDPQGMNKTGRIVGKWMQGTVSYMRVEMFSSGSIVSTGKSMEFRNYYHGSVINPKIGNDHGYTSIATDFNTALWITFPTTLQPNQSLVSTETKISTEDVPNILPGHFSHYVRTKQLRAAVLTVLDRAVPSTVFRPPYIGDEKPLYDSTNIQYQKLPSLPLPSSYTMFVEPIQGKTRVQEYADFFKPVWILHRIEADSEYVRPALNQPGYYREAQTVESEAAMLLVSDAPDKQELLINFIQYGIDSYFASTIPGVADRALSKWPALFAGIMLNEPRLQNVQNPRIKTEMIYYGNGWNGATALWRVSMDEGRKYEHISPYPLEQNPWCQLDSGNVPFLTNDGYRRVTHSWTWIGTALSARLMHAKSIWDHDSFFDYIDRWMTEPEPYYTELDAWANTNPCHRGAEGLGYQEGYVPGGYVVHDPNTLTQQMWDLYRNYSEGIPIASFIENPTNGNAPLTVQFDASASRDSDGTIVSYDWNFGDGSPLGTGVTIQHTFNNEGAFPITLTVTDNEGKKGTDSNTVIVSNQIAPGLLLYLPFDGDYLDHSGQGHTVQCKNGCPSYASGHSGQAMVRDGNATAAQLEVLNAGDLTGMPQLTMAWWAKKANDQNGGGVLYKNSSYGMSTNKAILWSFFVTTNGPEWPQAYNLPIQNTAWHHYAFSYDGSAAKLYLDGQPVLTLNHTGSIASSTSKIQVGSDFNGLLDEIRIYSRALSDQEIQALYAG